MGLDTATRTRGTMRLLGWPGLQRGVCVAALLMPWLAETAWAQFNGDFSIQRYRLQDENFLDYKAYQPPYTWRYAWYGVANGMRGSVGSLSPGIFYMFHEIRAERDLAPYFTFLYTQSDESLFRDDPIEQLVEFRFGRGVYGSVIGFPYYNKEQDRMGFAVALGKHTDRNFLRLSRLNQYIQYNEQHEGTERFDPTPALDRLQARWQWGGGGLIDLDWREEPQTRLYVPDLGLRKTYRGRKVNLRLDWKQNQAWLAGLHYSQNREERAHLPQAPTPENPVMGQKLDWGWLDLYGAVQLETGGWVEFGLFNGLFANDISASVPDAAYRFRMTGLEVYGFWVHPHGQAFQWLFSLMAGPMRLQERKAAAPAPESDLRSWQYKWGVGIILEKAESYRFLFNTTWDPDITQRQWDGGNIQFQMYF